MSLTYLYNKLENMNSKEQYAYIQNIFFQFQIRPKINIDEIFKDIPGKQSAGKNPLGYLLMHLRPEQVDELIPKYLRDLIGTDTFSTQDRIIMDTIYSATDCITNMDILFYFPYKTSAPEMLSVFQFGVGKYSEWSFLKINPYTLIPAMFRHLYKYFNISRTDEETGLSHLAHAECNKRMIELIINNYNNEVNHES